MLFAVRLRTAHDALAPDLDDCIQQAHATLVENTLDFSLDHPPLGNGRVAYRI